MLTLDASHWREISGKYPTEYSSGPFWWYSFQCYLVLLTGAASSTSDVPLRTKSVKFYGRVNVTPTADPPTTMGQSEEQILKYEQLCNLTVLSQPKPKDGEYCQLPFLSTQLWTDVSGEHVACVWFGIEFQSRNCWHQQGFNEEIAMKVNYLTNVMTLTSCDLWILTLTFPY